jgi:hypothetical protein
LNRRVHQIEMLGEEHAARLVVPGASQVSPGMVYLHTSRNIHQMLMERTRAVTIYLAVASLLWTTTGVILRAETAAPLMVPLATIQYWSLPVTAGALAALAVLVGLWLIRLRVGLIYEVAKMNTLLGEPSGRFARVGLLSVSTLVQTLVNLGGGGHAAILALCVLPPMDNDGVRVATAVGIGAAVALTLQLVYVVWIYATARSLNLASPPPIHG